MKLTPELIREAWFEVNRVAGRRGDAVIAGPPDVLTAVTIAQVDLNARLKKLEQAVTVTDDGNVNIGWKTPRTS